MLRRVPCVHRRWLMLLLLVLLQLTHNRASTTRRERENVQCVHTRSTGTGGPVGGELRRTIVRQLRGGSVLRAVNCDAQSCVNYEAGARKRAMCIHPPDRNKRVLRAVNCDASALYSGPRHTRLTSQGELTQYTRSLLKT